MRIEGNPKCLGMDSDCIGLSSKKILGGFSKEDIKSNIHLRLILIEMSEAKYHIS